MERGPQREKPFLRIVKLGGSSITRKDEFETLHPEGLQSAAKSLGSLPGQTIIVHGAGSFGHFQASQYGIAKGNRDPTNTAFSLLGVAETRRSVTFLSNAVVAALCKEGIPAVSISPFPSWVMRDRQVVTSNNIGDVSKALEEGLVPVLRLFIFNSPPSRRVTETTDFVLHGDVVYDEQRTFTILSGDTIISCLVEHFRWTELPHVAVEFSIPLAIASLPLSNVDVVVFLTDVDGVYDLPPSSSEAKLLSLISEPKEPHEGEHTECQGGIGGQRGIITSTAAHDVTGGMRAKIAVDSDVTLP